MSQGNPIVQVRMPMAMIVLIEDAIESANYHRKGEPYDMSSWIRSAIKDKLAHLARSKRPRTELVTQNQTAEEKTSESTKEVLTGTP